MRDRVLRRPPDGRLRKSAEKKDDKMDEREQCAILEEIARNEDNYPRDRIAAVRALREIDEPASGALTDELEALVKTK